MEPQPAPPPSAAVTTISPVSITTPLPHLGYPDSIDSSPGSRNTDSWDDQPLPTAAPKLRLMCSYGGHIVPRPHDKSLCYVGGDTRIVVADRHSSLSDLSLRLSKTLLNNRPFTLKYQLPHEDLDSLISVTTDEDLENMVDEYDRVSNSIKPSRLRVFLFPIKPDSAPSSIILDGSAKSEDWFLNALNASGFLPRGMSADSATVNCLLGLDDDVVSAGDGGAAAVGGGPGEAKSVVVGGHNHNHKQGQDVQSVPDSPMLDHTSSFGSTSSSPVLANLPPIRVHVDDNIVRVQDQKMGFEEQFQQLSVGGQKQEEGFSGGGVSTAATGVLPVVSGVPVGSQAVMGEYTNRVFAEEEYRKLGQLQQKPSGVLDLPSPDSVSSDSSVSNAISRQNQGKPLIYQNQMVQIPSGTTTRALSNPVDPNINTISDPNSRIHIQQQIQDFGYVLSSQFDPQQQQPPPPSQQPSQQPPQQFIHAGTHYLHHHPSGQVPISSYYPMYPPQQQTHPHHHPQLEQPYPVYFMRQPQAYNMPTQQPGYSENIPSGRPQTPPLNPTLLPSSPYNPSRNQPTSKPELTATNIYRTTNTAPQSGPQLVQVPSNQHPQQFMGFSQIHHPSQSIAPGSAAPGNYTYEFADPTHAQIYYTQPMAPSQYQTMTSASGVVLSEASSEQQSRTSQPL